MDHLKVMKLINSLASAKQVLDEFGEYDDYNVVELLEMKYEKIYLDLFKN
jgi:hypothetical protein